MVESKKGKGGLTFESRPHQWNKEEVFRGQADIPLYDWGRQQATAIGEALKGKGHDHQPPWKSRGNGHHSGPYSERHPILQDPRLTDVDYGEWQELPQGEVKIRYPQLYQTWVTNPGEVTFPGGEGHNPSLIISEGLWTKLKRPLLFRSP